MTEQQQRQVFAPGEIRAVDQQVPLLTQASQQERHRRKATIPGSRIKANRQTGEITIGGKVIPYGELLSAIRELSDPTPAEEPTVPVQVKLTTEQHRRLKVYCAKYEFTQSEAIALALASAGAFRNPF